MRRVLKITLIVIGVLVLMTVAYWAVVILSKGVGGPIRWEIPAGYRGWVVVHYEDPSCPPLRRDGIYLVIPISPSGRGCTASTAPLGWRYHRFEYVNPDGTRTKAEVHSISYRPANKQELVFVGTEEELKSSGSTMPMPW